MRRKFTDVLKSAQIDFRDEYIRLYRLFNGLIVWDENLENKGTVYDFCRKYFLAFPLPLRGTCVSLKDFNNVYGFDFPSNPSCVTIDDLISLCEYTYNLAYGLKGNCSLVTDEIRYEFCTFYRNQVDFLVEKLGYISNVSGGITDFVPKNPAAIAVAEIIEEDLSYDVIEYNHHSMRGDLLAKKATLVRFANLLEPNRTVLESVNKELSSNIFFMFNNMDLRHNNSTVGDRYYKPFVGQMSKEELETWYDELYQMCLLAFLELDNIERTERVKELKVNF